MLSLDVFLSCLKFDSYDSAVTPHTHSTKLLQVELQSDKLGCCKDDRVCRLQEIQLQLRELAVGPCARRGEFTTKAAAEQDGELFGSISLEGKGLAKHNWLDLGLGPVSLCGKQTAL